MIRQQPQYAHITPGGSFVVGSYGQGVCRHPLTRIIFWATMLKKRPEYLDLFNTSYQTQLNKDLIRHRFIHKSQDTIQDMIDNFDLSVCLECGIGSHNKENFIVRSWDLIGLDHRAGCAHDHYNYHVLLFAVLRNGWIGSESHGHTTLLYRDRQETVEYSSGDIFLLTT